ncbi:UNVERIFIED_CONTAM: Retrovirus-related Pol polyprotein from transposon TNT 1-94 [Sesamum angustifolium]|uniref:Retrovirus-related Pol polyprotein from transposon TNT 1-94 n=1 Tax=Sesamum angustifolium TaxID=2727405 RepID=A0AAW2Q8K6_9LAMI
MAMAGAKFEVVKFDGTGNFGLWQTRVKDLLAQQGILKVLWPQKPASMDDEDLEELQQRGRNHTSAIWTEDAGGFRFCAARERFNQIITDLTRLDVNIEDEDRAMILLCSLPFSYEQLNAGKSFDGDSLYVKANHDHGWKSEKEGSGKRNSSSKSRGRKTIHYYKCKEPGHMKRGCPKLKKQADEKHDDSSKSANVV